MSQSDYIHYKRVATELKVQSKLAPVFTSRQYTDYSAFALENQTVSSTPTYGVDLPSGAVSVFGVVRVPTACPVFPICRNTNSRSNRRPLLSVFSDARPTKVLNKVTVVCPALCGETPPPG